MKCDMASVSSKITRGRYLISLLFSYLAIVVFISGCGTITAHTSNRTVPAGLYMGVLQDLDAKENSDPFNFFDLRPVFATIDIPFSFVTDTVLIPIEWIEGICEERASNTDYNLKNNVTTIE